MLQPIKLISKIFLYILFYMVFDVKYIDLNVNIFLNLNIRRFDKKFYILLDL